MDIENEKMPPNIIVTQPTLEHVVFSTTYVARGSEK